MKKQLKQISSASSASSASVLEAISRRFFLYSTETSRSDLAAAVKELPGRTHGFVQSCRVLMNSPLIFYGTGYHSHCNCTTSLILEGDVQYCASRPALSISPHGF